MNAEHKAKIPGVNLDGIYDYFDLGDPSPDELGNWGAVVIQGLGTNEIDAADGALLFGAMARKISKRLKESEANLPENVDLLRGYAKEFRGYAFSLAQQIIAGNA